jgi:hypothetical protein
MRTSAAQVISDGFTHIDREWKFVCTSRAPTHAKFPSLPIDVIERKSYEFATSESHPGQYQYNCVVATPH